MIKDQLDKFSRKELEAVIAKQAAEIKNLKHEFDLEAKKYQRAKAALSESEERYSMLVESANVGIILIQNEAVIFANRWAVQISGYSEEEIQSKSFLSFIHPDDHQMAVDNHIKRLREEPVPESYQLRLLKKNGEVRWLELSPVRMLYGNIPSVLIFFKDISHYRHLEAQLLQSEKMAAVGQLAAGVAHEINNPMGFINSNLHSLKGYWDDLHQLVEGYKDLFSKMLAIPDNRIDPDKIAATIKSIQLLEEQIDLEYLFSDCPQLILESVEGAERIKKIILDLKDFAHPGDREKASTDINQSIESTLNIVWNELKYHVVVTKDFDTLPQIIVHPQQINQVFMNLLVNAAQAIEDEGEIKIQTRANNGHIEIKISDTGSGIAQEHLTKIFDPFFTTKPVGKGTGLGLNVSYNIIQNHKGTIFVKSQVGKGTTFTICLPV